MDELLFKPATDQAALLRSGELSARELLARADGLRAANLHGRAVEAYEEAEDAFAGAPAGDVATVRRARSLSR